MTENMLRAFEENNFEVQEEDGKIWILHQFGNMVHVVAHLWEDDKAFYMTKYYSELSAKQKQILIYLIGKQTETIVHEAVINF